MSDILFIGGPAHGQVMNVPDDSDTVFIPVPAGERSRPGEGGILILSSMDRVRYVRRRFSSPASQRHRDVMAPADMPPPAAMEALADILIRLWVESAPEPEPDDDMRDLLERANARVAVAQDESAPEPGPAATLAGDQ